VAIQPRFFIYFKGSILNDIAVGKCFINLHSSRILTREATENSGNNNFQNRKLVNAVQNSKSTNQSFHKSSIYVLSSLFLTKLCIIFVLTECNEKLHSCHRKFTYIPNTHMHQWNIHKKRKKEELTCVCNIVNSHCVRKTRKLQYGSK
jgi:hypothetical protein